MPRTVNLTLHLVNVGRIPFRPDENLTDVLLTAHEGGVADRSAPCITGVVDGQQISIGISNVTAGEILNRALHGEALITALTQDVAARWAT